ncbi:MAG: hypothetical protein MUO78_10565, partial [candidate division Zixibacteria bacterium]|nr:hypothetical protein [candidate division Zixibacteria bacterium]
MKKGILMVLLILLAFIFWTALASGNMKKEGGLPKPTHLQKTEPGQEAFPEVVLPRPHPVRPTPEDFKREVLDPKGWTLEKVAKMREGASPAEEERIEEKELFYCRAAGMDADCCYYYPSGTSYLACWGQVGLATLTDLDNNFPLLPVCPYPLYPFTPAKVRLRFYAPDVCTLYVQARIYGVDYSSGGAYPSGVICTSDSLNPTKKVHTAGTLNIDVPLLDTLNCCLYEPFFTVFIIDNTDDFLDPTYCPTAKYQFLTSWQFDQSGRKYTSYWNPYGLGGSWYDVVENGILGGAIYIQVFGYTESENSCPAPVDPWYFKDPYPPGAPCGVPDFDQYQMPGAAFCGPTAGANSIWWFASRGDISLEGIEVPTLFNEVAVASNTNPVSGTQCDSLQTGILEVIKAHGGWWFAETTVYSPDFWYIQKELRDCENVILLLGFWQEDPPGTWTRFGGHFVTLAGVDIFNLAFAFSDPAMDKAEGFPPPAGLGQVCGVHTPANDPVDHNSGITSYDYYSVAWPSTSPGGTLYLPDYLADWTAFQDQNFRPEHQSNHGTYNPALSVHVEIEQAIVVSPGLKEMQGEVQSSKAYEIENNHGGIDAFGVDFGAGIVDGLYKGSLIVGTDQGDLNCDYGDYYPLHTFEPKAPPTLDSFFVTGKAGDYKIYQLTLNYTHNSIPGLEITKYAFGFWVPNGGVENCEYAIEDVFVLHNTSVTDITGLQTGMW